MKVTIFGSGYVGLVTGACLADVGNHVICVDIVQDKIDQLTQGNIPIYEPGLESLISQCQKLNKIEFTTDAEQAVKHGDIIFIAVGTPSDEDGSADLQYVLNVARTIGKYLDGEKVIVDKSTVPVGTADKVRNAIDSELESRKQTVSFHVASNPEFLKEGSAIADFKRPDRIIIGIDNNFADRKLRELYSPFSRNHDKIMSMDIRSAELTKYAANTFLATKISIMNELSMISEKFGADIEHVRLGIGSDSRIGYQFIYPGAGYGGSCFPKDIKALIKMADEVGCEAKIFKSVEERNYAQKRVLFEKINTHYKNELKERIFAIWGLAFKPNTDDMREAPSRILLEALWKAGAITKVFDPEAMDETRRIYGDRDDLIYAETPESALDNADAMVLVTEWRTFQSPDFKEMAERLKTPIIFDGRNIFNPDIVKDYGFTYYSIGRNSISF